MKTIDFSYFIERYNAGEMDQNENVWFAKELEGNLSLQKEVLLRKKTDLILGRQDIVSLRNKLASIEKSRKAEAEKINKGKLHSPGIRYAAVFTGLIVIGSLMFLSFRTEDPAKLFKKYYQSYDNPGTTRSFESSRSPEVIKYNDAIEFYNSGEFDKAAEGFSAFLKNNPSSTKIRFLNGMASMEIRKFRDAESSFGNVIDQKINPYTIDANWYLAMCYLATDDKVKAKEQLRSIIKSESIYIKKAKRILRHL
jgi:TolA-binding protein